LVRLWEDAQEVSIAGEWAEWINSFGPDFKEWELPKNLYQIDVELRAVKRRYGNDITESGEWNRPSSTIDAAEKTEELAGKMRREIALKFLDATTGFDQQSYIEQYIFPGQPEFVCASVFRQLGRLQDRMAILQEDLKRYMDAWGDSFYTEGFDNFYVEGNRTFRRKVENFWGDFPGIELDENGQQIWNPESVFPFAAMNWCRTEMKAKGDAKTELKDSSRSPFLYFFTSPIGIGLIALSGVLVARKLTR